MNICIYYIGIIENLITQLDINFIKRNGQVIFQQNHFCTQNLAAIEETIGSLIKLQLNQESDDHERKYTAKRRYLSNKS